MQGTAAWRRRRLLLSAGALAATLRPAAPQAAVPDSASLLVAGPEDGAQARWGQRLAAALARGTAQATLLRVAVLGGADGVTAANRFATTAAPDGRTLLAFAGSAGHAALIGDSRAKFDPEGWAPVCAGGVPAVAIARPGLTRTPQGVRVALAGPEAPEAALLLALELMGVSALPVFVPTGAAEAALAQGAVDVALATGNALPARIRALGAQPWMVADLAEEGRDAAFPETPSLRELLPSAPRDPMLACRAALAAARLRAALVLPALTPADTLAAWRGAARRWIEEEDAREALEEEPQALPAGAAATLLRHLCPGPQAAAAYRAWLVRRLNWRAA
jgi:hypothetical protein